METDVLIVGSGPAGASAALALRGSGLDAILLERLSDGAMPRYHSVCGEAVSERMLRTNDVDRKFRIRDVDSITISSSNGISATMSVRGAIIDRPSLLADWRGRCGARLVRGTALKASASSEGFIVETTAGAIRCRYLIGADGAHSVVRRDIFGTHSAGMLPLVNTIASGEQPNLEFTVGEEFEGCYSWRFPSHDGYVSIGFPKGRPEPSGTISRGARHLPFGGVPSAVSGNALLVGDAAGLANALCYGGIGAAMLSGRKAAEAVIAGRPGRYGRWYARCIYRNPHFMEARGIFAGWSDSDIADAMRPLRGKASVPKGIAAIFRKPRAARVYIAVWLGFRHGWRFSIRMVGNNIQLIYC